MSAERERQLAIAMQQLKLFYGTPAPRSALMDSLAAAWNHGVASGGGLIELQPESNWARRQRLLSHMNSPAIIEASKTEPKD